MQNKSQFFLTQNNHLSFTNNDISMARCSRLPRQFKSEIKAAMQEILSLNRNKDIFIFLSGGSDSETIARCALSIRNFNFTAIIIDIDNGLNSTETSMAISFCKKRKINYRVINISSLEVLSDSEIRRIKKKYNCNSLSYLTSIFAAKKIQSCYQFIVQVATRNSKLSV